LRPSGPIAEEKENKNKPADTTEHTKNNRKNKTKKPEGQNKTNTITQKY
jgi:hypothetical protein